MASNQDLKKAQRKADELLPPRQCRRGRQQHQKMKPYLVLQYLQANTDENHSVSASEISGYLEEILGINADRRSIYSDIDEINAVACTSYKKSSGFLHRLQCCCEPSQPLSWPPPSVLYLSW